MILTWTSGEFRVFSVSHCSHHLAYVPRAYERHIARAPVSRYLVWTRLQTMMALLAAERDFVVVTTGEEAPGPGTWDSIFNRASHSHLT